MRQSPLPPITLALALCAALAGCAAHPELDGTVSDEIRDASYPDLVPIETLAAQMQDNRITPEFGPAIELRVARLKARAARLRGLVIDRDTRARMAGGIGS